MPDKFLGVDPTTVTSFHATPSAGGAHDSYSEADYFWPNPANPNGHYIEGLNFWKIASQYWIEMRRWILMLICAGDPMNILSIHITILDIISCACDRDLQVIKYSRSFKNPEKSGGSEWSGVDGIRTRTELLVAIREFFQQNPAWE
jgi:hypothetical protein